MTTSNGDIDYKAIYEQVVAENERLRILIAKDRSWESTKVDIHYVAKKIKEYATEDFVIGEVGSWEIHIPLYAIALSAFVIGFYIYKRKRQKDEK